MEVLKCFFVTWGVTFLWKSPPLHKFQKENRSPINTSHCVWHSASIWHHVTEQGNKSLIWIQYIRIIVAEWNNLFDWDGGGRNNKLDDGKASVACWCFGQSTKRLSSFALRDMHILMLQLSQYTGLGLTFIWLQKRHVTIRETTNCQEAWPVDISM